MTTPIKAIPETIDQLRRGFNSGKTRKLQWRVKQLRQLKKMLKEHEHDFIDALKQDLGKPPHEAVLTETAFVSGELDFVLDRLPGWVRPKRVNTPLVQQPASARIHADPLGVVLVIGPWNYPFQLILGPLVGALAAGNCVLLKPSEVASHTSAALARLLPQYVDNDCVKIVEGGPEETTAILREPFDHIFFTGGGTVGKIVMRAAAEHLTPVTLELGGKSPCIVDKRVDLDVAARRIVWGKFVNCGQTCIAPDHILVHEEIHDALVSKMADQIKTFYGADPSKSGDYGRIINDRHFKRLTALLASGTAAAGGTFDEAARYIAPTILTGVAPDSPVMADEIFGPILPVIKIAHLEEAITFITARPKPLALYIFSKDRATQSEILERTSSGGVCINDTIVHIAVPELPFGGVGQSGMGAYHGKASFDTFSHQKSVLNRSTILDPPIRYPPLTDAKIKLARRLL